MQENTTLLEFLQSCGFEVTVYDIGRRISHIPSSEFLDFERQELAYPFPLQQQAWFSLTLLSQDHRNDPVIWFLRFPLDETGKLVLAGRDYFLHRLLETSFSENQDQEITDEALKDNPHVFKPREDKLAIFHAIASLKLKQPHSRFYEHAKAYMSGSQGWEQWNFVGFQGIADLAVRLNETGIEKILINAIAQLPKQPLEALCQCLENIHINNNLTLALSDRIEKEFTQAENNIPLLSLLCRAISQAQSQDIINAVFKKILTSDIASHPDVVSAFSARCWEWIKQDDHATLYLQALSESDQETFNLCLADLMFMPGMREKMLGVIRDPARPDLLAEKFAQFMKDFFGHQR